MVLAYLVTALGYLPWSFSGYGAPNVIDPSTLVKVLTPRSIVRAFAVGFTPTVHSSANKGVCQAEFDTQMSVQVC